jgi:predicted nucleic acid-binding protein
LSDTLFDSTIVIDHLNGVPGARAAVRDAEDAAVSIITWIEVLAGVHSMDEEAAARRFLGRFSIRALTAAIAERAIVIRRERRLKLPDAIILATAQELGCVLVTRNTKDFPGDDPGIMVPYRL